MTDSIKVKLDLTPLSEAARSLIDVDVARVENHSSGEIKSPYVHRRKAPSPMSKANYQVLFGFDSLKRGSVASCVYAELNLPSLLVGQNYLHGTSVYAALVAALMVFKVHLARDGLSAEEIERLNLEHLSLQGATLTFLIDAGSADGATRLIAQMLGTLKLLWPPGPSGAKRIDDGLFLQRAQYSVSAYIKTNEDHIAWADDAPVEDIRSRGRNLVRVEVKLRESSLKQQHLTASASWKGARKRGVYKTLFNQTIGKVFQLDDDLRHKAPRPEVLAKLTPTERALVRGYLDGEEPRNFPAVKNATRPAGKFHRIRKSILAKARLDIDIPWEKHQRLDCHLLKDILIEPGNFRPPKELAPWCFCNANWTALKARMNEVLEQSFQPPPSRPAVVEHPIKAQ